MRTGGAFFVPEILGKTLDSGGGARVFYVLNYFNTEDPTKEPTMTNELELIGRRRRTIDTMRDLGFSQADREAEIQRQTPTPSTEKCLRCKTADALPDYPNCEACREVMRGWLETDIEVTGGKRSP